MNSPSTTQIIKSMCVPDMILERQTRLDAAFATIDDPASRQFVAYLLHADRDRNKEVEFCMDALQRYTTQLDRELWTQFMQSSGLWNVMSRQERERWRKVLDKYSTEPVAAFDAETTKGVFYDLVERKDQLRKEAVESLFRNLSWDHETNQPAQFSEKLIYQRFYDQHGNSDRYGNDCMDDLLRELYRLDSKSEPGHWKKYTTGYIEVQAFKNGNAHIRILRPDLVDKLNSELAKYWPGALPAPKKKAKKQQRVRRH